MKVVNKQTFESVIKIAKQAGDAILEIYNGFDAEAVHDKSDGSPLTAADLAAHKIIESGLYDLCPDIPCLSEESSNKSLYDYHKRKHWQSFWLVDPLDGTKEFIKKNGEFTVNIALIEQGVPTQGVVFAPVYDDLFFAHPDIGAYRQTQNQPAIPLPIVRQNDNTITVVTSRSHMNEETQHFVNTLEKTSGKKIEFISRGSSLKICNVVDGSADIYPRLGPTMEWDTAAAHAILKHCGKELLDYVKKTPIQYNKENLLNPWFITTP